jgi:ABC-2 type transport system permease protein
MIVVSDGDVIRNNVRNTAQGIMISPLGLDRYSNQTFGNKEFILNAVNYLTDESGIMNLRNREIRLRLLDKNKIQNEKLKWQLINTLLPMIFIALFGLSINLVRKRRYSRVV